MIIRVVARDFVAGVVVGGPIAPILRARMRGWSASWSAAAILECCRNRGWRAEIV